MAAQGTEEFLKCLKMHFSKCIKTPRRRATEVISLIIEMDGKSIIPNFNK